MDSKELLKLLNETRTKAAEQANAGNSEAWTELMQEAFKLQHKLSDQAEKELKSEAEEMEKSLKAAKTERKTKRVNLLMKPSLYLQAQSKAELLGISFNEYIAQLIGNDLKR